MSLLSTWEEKKNNIVNANRIAEDILIFQKFENLLDTTRPNYWRINYYMVSSVTSTVYPTPDKINGLTLSGTKYQLDSSKSFINVGGKYYGFKECYVYCNKDYDFSTQMYNDDAAGLYINYGKDALEKATNDNSTFIKSALSCTKTSVTIPFKRGLNHLMYLYVENTGDDGAYLTGNIYNQSWCDWLYPCKLND